MAIFTSLATAALSAIGLGGTFLVAATADETFIEFNPDDKISGGAFDESEDECE